MKKQKLAAMIVMGCTFLCAIGALVGCQHEHKYESVITKEATCTEEGIQTFTCKEGDDSYTEVIPALGHDFVDRTCTRCGSKWVSQGLQYTLSDDAKSYSVTAIGTCKDTNLFIPDTYNNLPVTRIGDNAFYYCRSLKSVNIPDSVTNIGERAFMRCSSLTSATIGNGVTRIGDNAFSECSRLTSVTIPDSVTSIGEGAFYECGSLKSVTIPDSITSIRERTFGYCYRLTSVTIGNSVMSIGDSAFVGCHNLTSITIPDSVKSIRKSTFSGCEKLIEVYNCSSLDIVAGSYNYGWVGYYAKDIYTSTSQNSKLFMVDDYQFYEDGSTVYLMGYQGDETNLTLPERYHGKIYSIYPYAFSYQDNLTSVTIPNSVASIGEGAFMQCSSLTSVIIPDGVTSIENWAFYGCSGLMSMMIPDSVTSIGRNAFFVCSSLTSVTIGSGVTSIGEEAFAVCDSLTSVTIPDSVTSIGSKTFRDCDGLTNVVFENPNGWRTFGTSISASELSDPATAAQYLTEIYYEFYWYRN